MVKGLNMNGDTWQTTIYSCFMGTCSWLIAHLPQIQAFITFCLTIVFLVYKIRDAKAKAEMAEMAEDEQRGNKNSTCRK